MSDTQENRFDYITEALLTASPSFHGSKVPMAHFLQVLQDGMAAAEALDKIKKALFYGRELGAMPIAAEAWENCNALPIMISDSCVPEENEAAKEIIHGIIGKFTEAGELLEALLKAVLQTENLDTFNLREEIGDGFWYDAIILQAIGSNFGEAQAVNIQKLRKRFPDRFTEYDANTRNLAEERKILEQGS